MTTDQPDPRAELLEHANRLHDAHKAVAYSNLDIACSHGREYSDRWDVYDYTRAAFVAVVRRLMPGGSEERAWRVHELMLDDTGEGVEYWLRQEAKDHDYEETCPYVSDATRPDGQPFECRLRKDHGPTHEATDGQGGTLIWHED